MTEHCETCRLWVHWEGSDCCQSAGLQNIAGPWGVLRPPPDFGCTYHEARPKTIKRICDTCCYWDRACGHWGARLRCTSRSTDDFAVLTLPHGACSLWEEYHG